MNTKERQLLQSWFQLEMSEITGILFEKGTASLLQTSINSDNKLRKQLELCSLRGKATRAGSRIKFGIPQNKP